MAMDFTEPHPLLMASAQESLREGPTIDDLRAEQRDIQARKIAEAKHKEKYSSGRGLLGLGQRLFGQIGKEGKIEKGMQKALRELEVQQEIEDLQAASGEGEEYGLSPLTYRNEAGDYVAMQPSKSGGMTELEGPDGFRYVPDSGRMSYNTPNILERDEAELIGAVKEAESVGQIGLDQALAEYQGKSEINLEEAAQMIGVDVESEAALAAGERERELAGELSRQENILAQADQKHTLVNDWIDQALGGADNFTTGFLGSKLALVEGTGAFDLAATVDSIKANIGFDKLQEMRANSPTGGALGQVSEFENRLLQATLGNLSTSQSKEQFKKNLELLKSQLDNIVNRGISSFEHDYGEGSSPFETKGGLKAVGDLSEDELAAEEARLMKELGIP